jgi:hypothetical protein
LFLLQVRPDQGGVHVHDQRGLGVGVVAGGMLTGEAPHRRPRCRAGRVDRFQRGRRVCGDGVDGAGHGRVGGDPAIDSGFGPQDGDVGEAVPPDANDTARSSTILAGSCTAVRFRHRSSAADSSDPSPLTLMVLVNSTPPVCPAAAQRVVLSTRSRVYNPVVFFT